LIDVAHRSAPIITSFVEEFLNRVFVAAQGHADGDRHAEDFLFALADYLKAEVFDLI